MKLSFRPAREADLDTLGVLEMEVFADPWSREVLRETFHASGVEFTVAETIAGEASELVAYAVVRIVGDSAEILNLAVAPIHRRQKVGVQLLAWILGTARAARIAEVFLEVREGNSPARALYEAAGFAQVGLRPKYYRRPAEDGLILRKAL